MYVLRTLFTQSLYRVQCHEKKKGGGFKAPIDIQYMYTEYHSLSNIPV